MSRCSVQRVDTSVGKGLGSWLAALVAGVVTFAFASGTLSIHFESGTLFPAGYTGRPRLASGRQLVMVYVGASTCGASNMSHLPALIARAKEHLARTAAAQHLQFVTVGVAVDQQASNGLNHLVKFGLFDEVSVGNEWANTVAQQYVVDRFSGLVATPQLVLTQRDILADGGAPGVSHETLIARSVGVSEIERWVKSGTPLAALEGK